MKWTTVSGYSNSSGSYLKAEDITGPKVATIAGYTLVEFEEGKEKVVLSFAGTDRLLVLNKTNAATLAFLYGEDVDEWVGKAIKLTNTKVSYQGKLVDSIRVSPEVPKANTPTPPKPSAKELADPDDEGDVPW